MQSVMAENKVRIVIQAEEDIRKALKLEAARQDKDMSELATEILRDALKKALKEIEASREKPKEK